VNVYAGVTGLYSYWLVD